MRITYSITVLKFVQLTKTGVYFWLQCLFLCSIRYYVTVMCAVHNVLHDRGCC